MKTSFLAFLFATFILAIGCTSAEQPEPESAAPPVQSPQPEFDEPSVGPDGHLMNQGKTPTSVQ